LGPAYKCFVYHPDSPTDLERWLQTQYDRFGYILIAVSGDFYIFREALFNEYR